MNKLMEDFLTPLSPFSLQTELILFIYFTKPPKEKNTRELLEEKVKEYKVFEMERSPSKLI